MARIRTKFETVCFEKPVEGQWEMRSYDPKDPTHHGPVMGTVEFSSDWDGEGTKLWFFTAYSSINVFTPDDLSALNAFINALELKP